jgi:bifunctional DNA-binding transcriptional regulator/antitoxin component of YhaV-PrlF toxin-antitoxin module
MEVSWPAEKKIGRFEKITKTSGYTYYVSIPKKDLDALGWRERQKVRVKRKGKQLVIRDWKPR